MSKILGIGGQNLIIVGIILALGLSFILVIRRLHNIGMSGWWALLTVVPIANLIVGLKCLVCQEGYQDTKRLDRTGKIIGGFILGFIILILLGGVVAVMRY